jgi:hypothetical protein
MSIFKDLLFQKSKVACEHGSHFIYLVPFEVFTQLPITLWKYNRPPDEKRVVDIETEMKQSQRMDGCIYLASVNNELVCYEGNHRREALKHLQVCQPILVDMIWNADDELLKREFARLNKAVSVPELYVNPNLISIKSEIQEFIKEICIRHPDHVSTKQKCQRPNFNRDNLTDQIVRIIKEANIDIDTFKYKIEELNEKYKHEDHSKLNPQMVKKCEKSGMWIFIHSTHLDTKDFL